MARAIGYLRVSTGRQADEGLSLAAQRDRVAAWAAAHGHELAAIESDEGISGRKAGNRPGLARAVEAACAGRGVLVVYSLSRAARSTIDTLTLVKRLTEAGAGFVSLSENIDTTTPAGRFFLTVLAALAEMESAQIGERVREINRYKRSRGERLTGQLPLGFRAVDGKLVRDERTLAHFGEVVQHADQTSDIAAALRFGVTRDRIRRMRAALRRAATFAVAA